MKTVLQSLKEMEADLLKNQSEIDALEQIEVLREQLRDKPGATEMLSKLQLECAPDAERTKTELDLIREAIQTVEDMQFLPETRSASNSLSPSGNSTRPWTS